MANKKHLALIKQGVEVWNEWRETNREIKPDLSGANLSEANLSGTDLSWTDLSWANLIGANLSWTDLREAKLREAKLREAKLREAKLSWTDLNGANLIGADLSGVNLIGANLREADLSGTDLSGADLSGVNLSGVNLSETKLSRAKLIGTNLNGTNLKGANLKGANLKGANLKGANLKGANLSESNLSWTDLKEANLSEANLNGLNLSGLNLSGKDLSGVNLSETNLSRIQALRTNFEGATFTGACLEDWNINSETNLNDITCDYVYLKEGKQERRPHDSNKNFAPGEFTKLFQKALETVDLIFSDGIEWAAFVESFQQLKAEINSDELAIQAIEKKSGGAFVIRVEVPPDADKAIIEESFWQKYKPILEAKDEQLALYAQVLKEKSQDLEDKRKELQEERQDKSKLINIVETMANEEDKSLNELQIKIIQAIAQGKHHDDEISQHLGEKLYLVRYYLEFLEKMEFITVMSYVKGYGIPVERNYANCQLTNKGQVAINNPNNLIKESKMSKKEFNMTFNGSVTGVAGNVEGNQNIYAPEQKQTLAEAAAEIQQLLTQLQSQGCSPEEAQQEAAKDLATKAQENPTTLGKLVKWGQSLGDTAAQTTVSEAAKEVVKLALRLSGVPLP